MSYLRGARLLSYCPHLVTLLMVLLFGCTAGAPATKTTPLLEREAATRTLRITSTPATDEPKVAPLLFSEYGARVNLVDACTDGVNTVLRIRTELDAIYWQIEASDLSPMGEVNFETAIAVFENGQLFASESFVERSDPEFDPLRQVAWVDQKFHEYAVPSSSAQYMLKAEVSLSNLPSDYRLPAPDLRFSGPGFITIPAIFNIPFSIDNCDQ